MNKEFEVIKKKLALNIIAKIVMYTIITLCVISLLVDGIYNDVLAESMSDIDRSMYLSFVQNKEYFAIVTLVITFFVVTYFVVKNAMQNIVTIIIAMESVAENPEEKIILPEKLLVVEGKLNEIRMQIVQAQKDAKEEEKKKNDLIMYMAHDLKTPLTSVIGYLSLVKEEKDISKKMREKYIDIALRKAERVEDLTNQFFEITRYNLHTLELAKENLDLTLLLKQLAEESFPMLEEKKLEIEVAGENKVEYVGDGDKLSRAFGNLIKNAATYAYANTKIYININKEKDKILVTFKNKGDKIPEHKLERIFEKFYRLDTSRNSSTGNAGLGLAITKEIINAHNGNIICENEDEYITFKIEL